MTSEPIAVVEESHAKDAAYSLGFNTFRAIPVEDAEDFDLSYFKETARWANNILPRLRCISGYDDPSNKGTWTGDREVAFVEQGDEDDQPKEARIHQASTIHSEIVEQFDRGAYMAVDMKGGGDAVPEEDR